MCICDVVSYKVRWARWRLPLETGRLVCLIIYVFVTERWRETRSALVTTHHRSCPPHIPKNTTI